MTAFEKLQALQWFSMTPAEDLMTQADRDALTLAAILAGPSTGTVQKTLEGGYRTFVIREPAVPAQFGYRWNDDPARDWRYRTH